MRTEPRIVFIGFDSREMAAYQVTLKTVKANLPGVMVRPLILEDLVKEGIYTRPTQLLTDEPGPPKLYDTISQAYMSTEFANSRFLAPHLALTKFARRNKRTLKPLEKQGWALFMDCDMLVRSSLEPLFRYGENIYPDKALLCVQHQHVPQNTTKMDGQVQQQYSRKNWSSVMMFNLDHPGIRDRLTLNLINTVPGRDLHRFAWLEDHEIGAIPHRYNFLNEITDPEILDGDEPVIVHFTEGGPWFPEYKNVPYADEWMEAMLF